MSRQNVYRRRESRITESNDRVKYWFSFSFNLPSLAFLLYASLTMLCYIPLVEWLEKLTTTKFSVCVCAIAVRVCVLAWVIKVFPQSDRNDGEVGDNDDGIIFFHRQTEELRFEKCNTQNNSNPINAACFMRARNTFLLLYYTFFFDGVVAMQFDSCPSCHAQTQCKLYCL